MVVAFFLGAAQLSKLLQPFARCVLPIALVVSFAYSCLHARYTLHVPRTSYTSISIYTDRPKSFIDKQTLDYPKWATCHDLPGLFCLDLTISTAPQALPSELVLSLQAYMCSSYDIASITLRPNIGSCQVECSSCVYLRVLSLPGPLSRH